MAIPFFLQKCSGFSLLRNFSSSAIFVNWSVLLIINPHLSFLSSSARKCSGKKVHVTSEPSTAEEGRSFTSNSLTSGKLNQADEEG